MRLSLIAMSGSGKSYWANQLAGCGFMRLSCDEMIASRLKPELEGPDGTVIRMGNWMGFPYQPGYPARESKYLNYEKQVLKEIFDFIERIPVGAEKDIVIDTTGSVIYTGKHLLKTLRKYTTVVHLATPPEIQEQMFHAYLENPRPVLWLGKFVKMPEEKNDEALARCYPKLLSYREDLYKQLAHMTIDYYKYRKSGFTGTDFLGEIGYGK